MAGNPRFIPIATAYQAGAPRVFLPFEEGNGRLRDLSGLLDFGTVVQIFDGQAPWQLTDETATQYAEATRAYFRAHGFTPADAVVAIGDPLVISITVAMAAQESGGRVTVLRWDRLPCVRCGRYKNLECREHVIAGRYVPVRVTLPLDRTRTA